jgi:hypothetical protein
MFFCIPFSAFSAPSNRKRERCFLPHLTVVGICATRLVKGTLIPIPLTGWGLRREWETIFNYQAIVPTTTMPGKNSLKVIRAQLQTSPMMVDKSGHSSSPMQAPPGTNG